MRGNHVSHSPIGALFTDCMPRLYDSFGNIDILIYYLNSQMITNVSSVFVFSVSRRWWLLCKTRWTLWIIKL